MYRTLLRIYEKTKDKAMLQKAVGKKWITVDEMWEIINSTK